MDDHDKPRRCTKCRCESKQLITAPNISGGQISEATRKLLSVPLGRKNMDACKTVSDIDRCVNKIEGRYSHMATGLGRNTGNYPKITPGHEE